jgi:hypothetical protein
MMVHLSVQNSLSQSFFQLPEQSEYSIDRGQRFQAIVDSAAKSAASAADSSQVSTMSGWYDDFSVVGAGFSAAFGIRPRAVQRKGLA